MSVTETRCPKCWSMNNATRTGCDNQARDVYMCLACEYEGIRHEFIVMPCPAGCLEVIDEKVGR